MGDARFEHPLRRLLAASDRLGELRRMTDEEVIQALAAASKMPAGDAYVANVLATEAMNRMHRARTLAGALAESEAKFRAIFHSIREPLVVGDLARGILDCNPAFERLVGYTAEELRGHTPLLFYDRREEYDELGRALREHAATGKAFVARRRFRRKSGEVFLAEVQAIYVADEGGDLRGFLGLVHDVGEMDREARDLRRHIDAAAEKVGEVEEAVVTHAHRTGEGGKAPDVPIAIEAARLAEALREAVVPSGEERRGDREEE